MTIAANWYPVSMKKEQNERNETNKRCWRFWNGDFEAEGGKRDGKEEGGSSY